MVTGFPILQALMLPPEFILLLSPAPSHIHLHNLGSF